MKVLITGIGFMGGFDLVLSLKKNGFEVIGADINKNSAAKFYCDEYYLVPEGNIENQYYFPRLVDILKKEKPDILLPASVADLNQLTFYKEHLERYTKLMIGDVGPVKTALDKGLTYDALQGEKFVPKAFYSEKGLVLKPMVGKGARGIQYLNDNHFVMEKLEGADIDVDVIAMGGEVLLAQCKTRERAYGGTMVEGQIIESPKLVELVKTIIKKIPIDYLSVIQFKGTKLLEVNPRMAGAIIDQNVPLMAINLALNKITKDDIRNYKQPIGKRIARTMFNYEYQTSGDIFYSW